MLREQHLVDSMYCTGTYQAGIVGFVTIKAKRAIPDDTSYYTKDAYVQTSIDM
jgi:predicted RNA-binding protein with PUA-like domain